jgi:two-component system nitrate/nitrite response regulator NarL
VTHQPPRLRLLLVDDQPLFRRALASLIAGQFDMSVAGEASDGLEALDKVRALRPDLVIMDINMPRAGGIEGVRAIRAAGFDVPIVMLTIEDEDHDLFDAITAGANGYLLKNLKPEQLYDGIRGAVRGEAPVSAAIATKLLDALRRGGPPPVASSGASAEEDTALTRREQEILQLVAGGLSNKEIGARLSITEGTVKNHVHHALEKLHLSNRVQAAAYAVRNRFNDPDRAGGAGG